MDWNDVNSIAKGYGGDYGSNGSSSGGWGSVDKSGLTGGLAGILGGLFGNSSSPYDAAQQQYDKYGQLVENTQNPYLQAGNQGLQGYQSWLQGMKDPQQFINHLMSGYDESPYAKYLTQQGQYAGQNSASASGLLGSTPYVQEMQRNAQNIASGDMNQYLQNILGVNNQYGQGQNTLMNTGQNAANSLTNFYSNMANNQATAAAGKKAGQNQDRNDLFSGIIKTGASLLPYFGL